MVPLPGREREAVDFFTLLPLELVHLISSYLSLPHFLACLAVCKSWNKKLSQTFLYWRNACEELGFSRGTFDELVAEHSSAKNVVYRILEHRHSIWAYRPRLSQYGDGFPYFMHYVCHQVKGDYIAGTVYKDFCPYKILVERLLDEGVKTVAILKPSYPLYTENRIVWAHIYQESHLFCASASGLWSVYNFNIYNKLRCPPVILQWKAEAMYDPEIRFDCCDRCGMVCTAKLVVSHLLGTHWELRVIEVPRESLSCDAPKKGLPLPSITKFRLKAGNKEITSSRNGAAKKRLGLLSISDTFEHGFCSAHHVLLQWSNTIEGHKLLNHPHGKALMVASPGNIYEVSYDKEEYDEIIMRNRGLNTEFALTEDGKRLGCIFQSELVTWEIGSPTINSRAPLILKSYNHEEIKLIALGHIYSIIGLGYNLSLMVVATRTGQKVLVCSDFAMRHCPMVSPYIIFCSSSGNAWLSDMEQSCRSTIIYWNKTNRCMEAIYIGKKPKKHQSQDLEVSKNAPKARHWWQKY